MFDRNLTYQSFTNPLLAGKFGDYDFSSNPYVDFSDIPEASEAESKSTGKIIAGMPIEEFNKLDPSTKAWLMYQDSQERQERYRREERDPEFLREQAKVLDDLQAKQMARAQKYGKESIFYDFMYRGLPNMQRQKAFSKYAFADIMPQIVSNAYARIDGSTAVNTPYMSVNPMGGIG